ncbi:glycosyltransferase family 2 protein [Serratia fonticola]|uniref:glycosyltransferase family 2 protein n=4 Tax=Serratia fonticola TaxID=47917 RepID=UPI0027FCB674|nr:glycosyltransferase family 2 protein [Serratia fonticola]MDQ7210852.1 glycosyltransferase family 2 protein [Serratia fonticola]HBE9080904.1 glycosyltransferase family 2 protein [Serratia fonticola]HBE9091431.1 glycosyltransferase family 2 protein [Serratia fonticola]HBE9153924.1 glycosyltransferase family 2 protein [Serratia fonticola]
MKTIEVILASYNGCNYIREQIFSILSNFDKLNDFECKLLVSDDGSTDSTVEIIEDLKKSDDRIFLVNKNKKGGVKLNFACLINASNADYVFFSDQDDLWLPDKISLFIERFNEVELNFNGPILVHSDLTVTNKNLSPINASMFEYQNINKSPSFSELIVSNSITGCVMACNRELISILKSCKIKDSIMHDWYAGLCASAFGVISFVDQPLILYRQHGANQVGAKSFALVDLIKTDSIKDKLRQTKKSIVRTQSQAEIFLSDFTTTLDDDKKILLKSYIESFNAGVFNRANLFFYKQFKKKGNLRNIFFFVFYVLLGKNLQV